MKDLLCSSSLMKMFCLRSLLSASRAARCLLAESSCSAGRDSKQDGWEKILSFKRGKNDRMSLTHLWDLCWSRASSWSQPPACSSSSSPGSRAWPSPSSASRRLPRSSVSPTPAGKRKKVRLVSLLQAESLFCRSFLDRWHFVLHASWQLDKLISCLCRCEPWFLLKCLRRLASFYQYVQLKGRNEHSPVKTQVSRHLHFFYIAVAGIFEKQQVRCVTRKLAEGQKSINSIWDWQSVNKQKVFLVPTMQFVLPEHKTRVSFVCEGSQSTSSCWVELSWVHI